MTFDLASRTFTCECSFPMSASISRVLNLLVFPRGPIQAVLLMDLSDAASTSFWRVRNPGAVAMVEAHFTAQPG